jgi:hypothetical protein
MAHRIGGHGHTVHLGSYLRLEFDDIQWEAQVRLCGVREHGLLERLQTRRQGRRPRDRERGRPAAHN